MGATPSQGSLSYHWHYPTGWNSMAADFSGSPVEAEPGSHEEFITEHYWGYCAKQRGTTLEYRVEHPRWKIWSAQNASLNCDVGAVYGSGFREGISGAPASAFVADGSEVTVRSGIPI